MARTRPRGPIILTDHVHADAHHFENVTVTVGELSRCANASTRFKLTRELGEIQTRNSQAADSEAEPGTTGTYDVRMIRRRRITCRRGKSPVVDCLICKIKIKTVAPSPSPTRDRESSSQLKPAQPPAANPQLSPPVTTTSPPQSAKSQRAPRRADSLRFS